MVLNIALTVLLRPNIDDKLLDYFDKLLKNLVKNFVKNIYIS